MFEWVLNRPLKSVIKVGSRDMQDICLKLTETTLHSQLRPFWCFYIDKFE